MSRPFVSRQLIQRFTASFAEAPAYVKRVAPMSRLAGLYTAKKRQHVFGTGERGDLAATIAPIRSYQSVNDANATPSNVENGRNSRAGLKFVFTGPRFRSDRTSDSAANSR